MKEQIEQLEKRVEMLELLVKALSNNQPTYVPYYPVSYPTYVPNNPLTPTSLNPTWTCGHNIKA